MALNFEVYTQKGNEFINKVAAELGNPEDKDHAARVIQSVLHSMRNIITPEESMHLISQLPMYLKAVYVDGWKLSESTSRIRSLDDFLERVRQNSQRTAGRDFGDNETAQKNIQAVFRVIKQQVNKGEIEDVKVQLPAPLAELWEK
jgi:uncharacterized protein (DUF2267 family)